MSFKEAMDLLMTLDVPDGREYKSGVPAMVKYLNRIGYKVSDLAKLNILHMTGTKGKGSTLTFCESILRHQGVKTGSYINPHLVTVRERYRINGEPVSEEIFADHVFDLYEKLQKSKESETDMPLRFAFMTLMGFDMFLKHGVEAVALEVGIGGEFDCTNVIGAPVVCGVSSIHLDHVDKLGNTVQSIAWHKSGIFKPGAPAVTVPQTEGVISVLESRAAERGTKLILAPSLEDYETKEPIKLGLAGDAQKLNASLALQMCKIWNEIVKPGVPSVILDCKSQTKDEGIEKNPNKFLSNIRPNLQLTTTELKASNRGRTHTIRHADVTYFLDTAHTDISVKAYADWFVARTNEEQRNIRGRAAKVMLFYFARDRDLVKPLTILSKVPFDVALFCPLAVDEANRVESLYIESPLEEQMCWTNKAFEEWRKLGNYYSTKNQDQGHGDKNKGENSQIPTLSFVVPSLEQGLALATCGKDGGYLNREITERVCGDFPTVSAAIRDVDQVHVMIVGGHKIVGHSLKFLENRR